MERKEEENGKKKEKEREEEGIEENRQKDIESGEIFAEARMKFGVFISSSTKLNKWIPGNDWQRADHTKELGKEKQS